MSSGERRTMEKRKRMKPSHGTFIHLPKDLLSFEALHEIKMNVLFGIFRCLFCPCFCDFSDAIQFEVISDSKSINFLQFSR
jgi:hypothetical protein